MVNHSFFCPGCNRYKGVKDVTTAGRCKTCDSECIHPMDLAPADDGCEDFMEDDDDDE